jgi:hypothetical protein
MPVVPSAPRLSAQCKQATLEALVALGGKARRADILSAALERGHFTAEHLAEPGPPGRPDHPRLVDHYLAWSLTWLKRDGMVSSLGDSWWAITERAEHLRAPVDVGAAAPEPPGPGDRAAYRAYLRSPEWAIRRQAALERAGGRCQLDRTHEGPVDVHHNTYDRRGDEAPEDLIVLCRECHARHHGHELAARRRRRAQERAAPESAPQPQPARAFAPLRVDVAARHAELTARPDEDGRTRRWRLFRGRPA